MTHLHEDPEFADEMDLRAAYVESAALLAESLAAIRLARADGMCPGCIGRELMGSLIAGLDASQDGVLLLAHAALLYAGGLLNEDGPTW